MFDPQMLFNMLGSGGGMNFMNNNISNGTTDNSQSMQNPLMNMLGGMNGNMLTGLMQMFGGGNNNMQQPTTGHNTYINNKISNNQNVNSELYHLIKNSESIL